MKRSVGLACLLAVGWVLPSHAGVTGQQFVSTSNKVYYVVAAAADPVQVTTLMMTTGSAVALAEINVLPDPVATAVVMSLNGKILLTKIRSTGVITGLTSSTIVQDGNPANGEFDPAANGGEGLLILPGGGGTVSFYGTKYGAGTEPVALLSKALSGRPAAFSFFDTRKVSSLTLFHQTIAFPVPSAPIAPSNGSLCNGFVCSSTPCDPALDSGADLAACGTCNQGCAFGGERIDQSMTLDDTVGSRVGNDAPNAEQADVVDGFLLSPSTDLIVFVVDGAGEPDLSTGVAGFGLAAANPLAARIVLYATAATSQFVLNPPSPESISAVVSPDGFITTDPEQDGATGADPIETTINTPPGGNITISEGPPSGSPPPDFGFILLGQGVNITAPPATASDPMVITFKIDKSLILPLLPTVIGLSYEQTLLALIGPPLDLTLVQRNGVDVPLCVGAPGFATPDPCVSSRTVEPEEDLVIQVLTSAASEWTFTLPTGACPETIDGGCTTGFEKGLLLIKQDVPGREKLIAKLLRGPALGQTDFGNPLDAGQGGTGTYTSLCVYDGGGDLAGGLVVDRPGQDCDGSPCWKPIGPAPDAPNGPGKGYVYKDDALVADGVGKLLAKGGSAGQSKVIVKGTGSGVPTGIPAALVGSTSATMQLRTTDGPCVSVTLADITRAEAQVFKAK